MYKRSRRLLPPEWASRKKESAQVGPPSYVSEYRTSGASIAGLDSCNRQQLWALGVYVPELSSPVRDTRTAIRRRDGLEMLITSNRGGTVGLLDVWASTRDSVQENWSPLINLNQENLSKCALMGIDPAACPVLNTAANDGAPALSWDGLTMIFYSNRPGGSGGNDLYISTRTKLPD